MSANEKNGMLLSYKSKKKSSYRSMIQIILKTKTLIYKHLKCNHAVLVFLRSSNRLTKKSIITLNLAYKQGMEMLKSIFNHVLSPFFTTFLQKWHLNRKNTYFSQVLYCIEFPNPFPNFHCFHTYIVHAR